jgi:hypothetical protein
MDAFNRVVQLRLAVTQKRLEFGTTPINLETLRKTYYDITVKDAELRNLLAEVFEIFPPFPGIPPYIPPKRGEHQPSPPSQSNDHS